MASQRRETGESRVVSCFSFAVASKCAADGLFVLIAI